jgi:hypothetical protein
MSLRRALLVVTALAVTTFFVFWLWPATPAITPEALLANDSSPDTTVTAGNSSGTGVDEAGMSAAQRRQARISAMQDLLGAARSEPGNLQRTLQELRQLCRSGDDCNALIDAALASLPDQGFARLVASALERLPLYEAAMAELVMSMQTPARERYAAIHELRLQTLGIEETEALYGQEAAWAEYQFRFGELMSSDSLTSLSAEQRLAALEALRQEALGDYRNALAEVDGSSGRYERELAVLTAGVTDQARIDRLTQQLREQYFGTEQAAAMLRRDDEVKRQQDTVQSYRDAIGQLNDELAPLKAQMDDASWNQLYEQRLTQLRLQFFPSP